MKTFPLIIISIVLAFFSFSGIVFSHSGGASFEKQVGDYLFDIGYSPEELESGTPMRFTFELYSLASTTKKLATYNNIWTRISRGDTVLYTAWLHQPTFGIPALSYVFPDAGEYELSVRFLREDGLDNITVSDATFPLHIAKGAHSGGRTTPYVLVALFIGFVLGYLGALFIKKKKAVEQKAVKN